MKKLPSGELPSSLENLSNDETPQQGAELGRLGVGLGLLDKFKATRRSNFTHDVQNFDLPHIGEDRPDTLSVWIPGIAGNIKRHTRTLIDVAQRQGDVLLIQPSGERYFQAEASEQTAEAIFERVSRVGYDHLVVNGVSMGGNTAYDSLSALNDTGFFAEQSVEPHVTMFDTPSGRQDLVGPARIFGPSASKLPFGHISNKIPLVKYGSPQPKAEDLQNPADLPEMMESYEGFGEIPTSFFFDQLQAIVSRKKPALGSMAFVGSMVYYQSLKGGDIVNAERSLNTWRNALDDESKLKHIKADTKHVDFEGQPVRSRVALQAAYRWHNQNR